MASGEAHPLKSWSLGGFRSIEEFTTFELGGLNVLVGANSAGKSSVLYSMLMAAQSLANPLSDRPFVLNGPSARLGLPDDILHDASDGRFEIAFELSPPDMSDSYPILRMGPQRFSARIASSKDQQNDDFNLERIGMRSVPRDSDDAVEMTVTRRSRQDSLEAFAAAGLSSESARKISASETGRFGVVGASAEEVSGVRMSQFLPRNAVRVVNLHEYQLTQLTAGRFYWDPPTASRRQAPGRMLSAESLLFIREFLESEMGEFSFDLPQDEGISANELRSLVNEEEWRKIETLTGSEWFEHNKERLPYEGFVLNTSLPDAIDGGIEAARRWFGSNVRHLGPLRAAPQPLYGLPEAAAGMSVGRNGEYTAAVLSAHRDRVVDCPNESGDSVRRIRLAKAVNDWMSRLGLLSTIQSQERGKLGFELRVEMEGVGKPLDLTTVGVGVSQALPVVVLGLLTPPGSLLLFEQPELHLHPDVQAALGDFFLALAFSGRQLVIETHSEYLINRLRRRAAEGDDSTIGDLTRLFFFERDGGKTSISHGRIAPGGGTPDWPSGFLDTASREIEAITVAALRRLGE